MKQFFLQPKEKCAVDFDRKVLSTVLLVYFPFCL